MIAARRRAFVLLLGAGLLLLAAALAWQRSAAVGEAGKPTLLLLTSLPLVFGEDFALDAAGSPALTALEKRYRVVPIATSSDSELRQGNLLLMAQPLAQPAEDLVALDDWVRRGGRVLLLADPLLERPDSRPLTDPSRPPAMFMDTGLLGRWGLRLDAPEERGPKDKRLGGQSVATVSPGTLHGTCAISGDRIVARCKVGRGFAVIVADADWIEAEGNLDALVAELTELERA